jgi:hypothetical protein
MFGVVTSHDMAYNISKIQLKIIYIYCRNIDLVILRFYFSSNNCSSKVYTSLEKVVSCYTEQNKIEFAISGFFCDLLWILQGAAKTHKEWKIHFARGSLERFELHKTALGFSAQVPTRLRPSHLCPQRRGWAHRRRGRTRAGKQVSQGWDWSHPWPIGGGCWTGDASGERRRQRRGGTTRGVRIPARAEAMLMNVWHG